MQGPYGSTEAGKIDGTEISPVTTWDSKITTVVAMLGGISHLNQRVLKRDNLYDRFYAIVDREMSRVFTDIQGENLPFKEPIVSLPCLEPCNFDTCMV